jgi:erythromycin esterase
MPWSTLEPTRAASDRAPFLAIVGNARVVGISEMTEGAHEFPPLVQSILRTLAENSGFRGLAVQAPMSDALELDRYVRTGFGDPRRLLRILGSHWETQEMLDLVEWMRTFNQGRTPADRIGFFGFELPNAAHAVQIATSLSDSVAGRPLSTWLTRELKCVATGESAAWGRDGPAADSSFWNRCRTVAGAAVDSLAALRARIGDSRSSESVSFAEQAARLVLHHVSIGLRRLPRHQVVAEHVMWVANSLGADGKLLVWGRDVESGRLVLDGNTMQSAVALAKTLGERYRNFAFTFGEGSFRARPVRPDKPEPDKERTMSARPPAPGSYEDVLGRARLDAFTLDMRSLPADTAGAWLKGPRPMRLISGVYTPDVPHAFETEIEFPKHFDALLFIRRATPAVPLKR